MPQVQRVKTLVTALVVAYRDGDRTNVEHGLRRPRQAAWPRWRPSVYPDARDIRHRGALQPLQAVPHGLAALPPRVPRPARELPPRVASGLLGGHGARGRGVPVHAYGMVLRMMISGRPPVTNMYESVIWVAWGAVLFALVFEVVYKVRYFAACAAALAVLCLILADNVPILDGSIEPARARAARQHVAHRARPHDHARLRGLHPRHGPRPPEPRPLLLRPAQGGALQEPLALPLPRAAGGDALPRGGHRSRRDLGLLLLGPLLGLGPQGDLGPHRPPRLPRHPPRPDDRLDQGLRDGGGLDPRLPRHPHGLVRRQLRARHRPALLRLRLRRLRLRGRLRGLRAARHRGSPSCAARAASPDAGAGGAPTGSCRPRTDRTTRTEERARHDPAGLALALVLLLPRRRQGRRRRPSPSRAATRTPPASSPRPRARARSPPSS